jgi:hypothetical protein
MCRSGLPVRYNARIKALGLTKHALQNWLQMGLATFLDKAKIPRDVPGLIIEGKLSAKDVEYWRQFAKDAAQRLESPQRRPVSHQDRESVRRKNAASYQRYDLYCNCA